MKKEFVPYELALELKQLGFSESCCGGFDNKGDLHIQRVDFQSSLEGCCLAPLYSQVFRWFREKYDLIGWIEKYPLQKVYVLELPKYNPFDDAICFNTYEEAELACLQKLIEIVKTK